MHCLIMGLVCVLHIITWDYIKILIILKLIKRYIDAWVYSRSMNQSLQENKGKGQALGELKKLPV